MKNTSMLFLPITVIPCDLHDSNLKKVAQGKMSKVFYEEHSYVIWGINSGGGIVHDPECKCKIKEN